jgi:preprotein translocase subunit SecD
MRTSIVIFALLLFAVVINMPSQIQIGSKKFFRPKIDIKLLGRNIYRDLDFKLGLDLRGGTHLVYQIDVSKVSEADVDQAILATRNNIERRVNLLGVSEALVQTSLVGQDHRLLVELPGVSNIQQALGTIGQTAMLEFKEAAVATPSSSADFKSTGLTGADLRLASVQFGGNQGDLNSQPSVGLEFNSEGAKKFAQITKRNIGQTVAIFLDDQLVVAPVVKQEITDGQAVISGEYTLDEAKQLTIQLNAGALPVPIKIIEQRNIGATLGNESVAKSLFAGIIGLVLISLFMLVNYGFKGLLADFALLIYILLSLAAFKIIPVTLTLAGIAGFILSVGMAVDANILIFERMKEEIRWGRPKAAAMELAYHRAWTSIRDSNVSSLITASILFWFGSGSIRGFALTLIVGILMSLFTAITVTRTLLRAVYSVK